MREFSGNERQNDAVLRELVADAISTSTKSRDQIADELTSIVGCRITRRMLDDFCSRSKVGTRFPAAWVAAFCEVTGDESLVLQLLPQQMRQKLDFADRELAIRKMQQEQARWEEARLREAADK